MDMGVDAELLIPRMQHAEETDLCAEQSRIARHFEESFSTGAEQEIVEDPLVLQDQWCQATGECEDNMKVTRGQELLLTGSDPAFPSPGLTLWAMPIPAGVVVDGAMAAASALIDMTAQCGGTTARNGQQHFDMLPTEPVTVSFDEGVSRSADQIGHLERWPAHLLALR
jgi:hypothetical protein